MTYEELDTRWNALIEELNELRRRLGLRPWQDMEQNPHALGSDEYDAFESVREREIAIIKELNELRPQIWAAQGIRQ